MKYTNLKLQLKELATIIKELKSHRKLDNRGNWKLWSLQQDIDKYKKEFRYKHIAYCLLRGKTYNEIETPARNNPPNMCVVNKYMEQHNVTKENVCAGS